MNGISTSVNIPVCTSIQDIQAATCEDTCLQELKVYIIQAWPHRKGEEIQIRMQYWPIRNELAMIDGIMMKG